MDGQGELQMSQGHGWYKGEFSKGVMTGKGSRMFGNGDNYSGEWQQSKMHGTGVYNWNNSDAVQYLGQFYAGQAKGSGKKSWQGGTYFVGQFEANSPCGNGLLVTEGAAGESVVAGTFEPGSEASGGECNWVTPDGSACTQHVATGSGPQSSPK